MLLQARCEGAVANTGCVYRSIDLATESPNAIGDGRSVLLLAGAVRLAVQVEESA